jgi:uncharacterized protein (DUF1810 family)
MFDLNRFVKAQEPVIETVLRELRVGRKETHWMWFVFPQLRGLGRSPMARHYGIENLAEARAYLGHVILGPRLKECVEAVLGVTGKTLHEIFGSPDDVKFCSSMTLFALADGNDKTFREALTRYCAGGEDAATLDLLGINRN